MIWSGEMDKQPACRPSRRFPEAERILVECDLSECIHCGQALMARKPWYMRKTVQTMAGPVFVAGKSKKCVHLDCTHEGVHFNLGNPVLWAGSEI